MSLLLLFNAGEIYELTANGIVLAGHVLDSPDLTEVFELDADGIDLAGHVLDTPALSQVHSLRATPGEAFLNISGVGSAGGSGPINNGDGTYTCPSASGIRFLVLEADLVDGAMYEVEYIILAATGVGTIAVDWCDTSPYVGAPNFTVASIPFYPYRHVIRATRADYTSTYRFADITTASGVTVTLLPPRIRRVTDDAIVIGPHVLDTPALVQAHSLVATEITFGPHQLDTPTLETFEPPFYDPMMFIISYH